MKTSINPLKKFLPYIKNTLENTYSNGVIEKIIILVNLSKELLLFLEISEILKLAF